MTTDEIAQKLKTVFEKKKELQELSDKRREEERAIVLKYKVAECNQERSELVNKYSALQSTILEEIRILELELGAKL